MTETFSQIGDALSNMNLTPAILLDIALVAVLIITMLKYRDRGLVSGLLDLVGNIAALIIAWFAGSKAAPVIFESVFKNGLIERTADTIQKQGQFNLNSVIAGISDILPKNFVDSITQSADGLLQSNAPELAQQIVEQVISPLVEPIITVVVFFAAYLICKMLIAFVATALTNINKIPMVGSVNHTLGAVIGVVAGIINAVLILCFLWAVVAITSDSLPVINSNALSGSFLYTMFSAYNPFA